MSSGQCSECGKGIGHFMDCSQHPDFASPEVRAEVRKWLCRTCQNPCSVDSPFCSDACKSAGWATQPLRIGLRYGEQR